MLKSVFDFNSILGAVAGSSIIFGAVYMLRFFQKTMFGPSNNTTEKISDIGTSEMLVLVPIAVIVIVTGVFPNLILNVSQSFVESLNLLAK